MHERKKAWTSYLGLVFMSFFLLTLPVLYVDSIRGGFFSFFAPAVLFEFIVSFCEVKGELKKGFSHFSVQN